MKLIDAIVWLVPWFNHDRFIINSFCYSLDVLLDGGLWTGELVEICGVPGSGKTQVCVVFLRLL